MISSNEGGLRTIKLGAGDLEASVIGYGTYHLLDKLDPFTAIESLGDAFAAGITLFDTSDNYGTELAIGKAVQEGILPRDRIIIATKTGLATSANEASEWGRGRSADTRTARVRRQVEKSLWLLGDDVGPIDLYQLHVHDPTVAAIETARIMNQLIDENKIRSYGVSNYGEHALRELIEVCDAHELVRPVSLQTFHNMLTSFDNETAISVARATGMVMLAHSPLHKGALTDSASKIFDAAVAEAISNPRDNHNLQDFESFRAGTENIGRLREYARSCGHSLAELGIAWLAMQGCTVVLTACTKPKYVTEALQAADWQIDKEGLELIDSVRSMFITRIFAGQTLEIMKNMKLYYR